jgi:hypothetical protein
VELKMSVDYFRCELCGAQLVQSDLTNETKFPVTRRFENELTSEGLLAVRCAECANLPYRLEEGLPFRIDMIGRDETYVLPDCNSTYNYWPMGIGHVLEVYSSSPSDNLVSAIRSGPVEVGFLVGEDVNLIVIAYRIGANGWNVTPYLWHAYKEYERGIPTPNPSSEEELKFTVAMVDTEGGKYRAVRVGLMSPEFASSLHSAIHEQIKRAVPDRQIFHSKVNGLYNLLIDDKVDSMLTARTFIN